MLNTEDKILFEKFKSFLKTIRFYKLVFSQGTRIDEKIFTFDGGLKDAITKGRSHCQNMGYRFVMVRPAIVDLEHQEKLKYSDPEWDESIDEARVQLMNKVDSEVRS